MGGSATASPRRAAGRPCSRSSSSMRQETPSTTRWWTTSSSRAGPPGPRSNSAARSSRPSARSRLRLHLARPPRSSAAGCSASGSADRSTRRSGQRPLQARRCACSQPALLAGEAQAQRVVVLHQPPQRPLQQRGVERARAPRAARAWLKWCGSGSSCSKNQRWIGVSGTGALHQALLGRRPRAPRPATRASSAIVWCWKSCLGVRLQPRLPRPGRSTWRLRMESPPSSKKLSWMPTRSTPSTWPRCPPAPPRLALRGAT